jgi:hypothetical protein
MSPNFPAGKFLLVLAQMPEKVPSRLPLRNAGERAPGALTLLRADCRSANDRVSRTFLQESLQTALELTSRCAVGTPPQQSLKSMHRLGVACSAADAGARTLAGTELHPATAAGWCLARMAWWIQRRVFAL